MHADHDTYYTGIMLVLGLGLEVSLWTTRKCWPWPWSCRWNFKGSENITIHYILPKTAKTCLLACSCPSISTTTMHRRIRKVCCEHAYGFEVQSLICRYGHILGTWERLRLHWHVGFGVNGHDDPLQLDLWTAVGCRGQPRIPLFIWLCLPLKPQA